MQNKLHLKGKWTTMFIMSVLSLIGSDGCRLVHGHFCQTAEFAEFCCHGLRSHRYGNSGAIYLLSCFCFRRPNGPNQNNVRSKCASPVKPRAKILTRTWAVSTLKRVLVQGLSGAAGREKIRQRARAFTAFLHPIQSIKYRPDFSYPVNPFCQGHFLTYQLSHHPGKRISLLY